MNSSDDMDRKNTKSSYENNQELLKKIKNWMSYAHISEHKVSHEWGPIATGSQMRHESKTILNNGTWEIDDVHRNNSTRIL